VAIALLFRFTALGCRQTCGSGFFRMLDPVAKQNPRGPIFPLTGEKFDPTLAFYYSNV
jgi:hypothetical protein